MKTKILMGGLLALILALSLACNQKKEEQSIDKDQVKAEIQAIENNFALAYNNRNVDSITYYADSAISYFAGESPIVGKTAILQHIANELKDFPEGAKLSFETIEIYVTGDGNNVAEIGAYTQVDSAGTLLHRGHYFSFFAKRNGKFVCMRDMTNSSPIDNE
jgi:ketosteroid isomerase-like protein